jgi:hypothetical protein
LSRWILPTVSTGTHVTFRTGTSSTPDGVTASHIWHLAVLDDEARSIDVVGRPGNVVAGFDASAPVSLVLTVATSTVVVSGDTAGCKSVTNFATPGWRMS